VSQTAVSETQTILAVSVESKPVRRRKRPLRLHVFGPLWLYLLFTLVPFYMMVLFAFREPGSNSPLPIPFSLDNFLVVWQSIGFSVFFQNSVYVAVLTLVFTTVIALAGGYAMARFTFRGKTAFMLFLLCTQFVPGAMMLIPLFQVFSTFGLVNNLFSLIIADTAFQLPLSIILMSGFIRNVPRELEEAAWVDGCSRLQAFRVVVLPLLRPALVAIGAFAFIGAWNNFLFALMFISKQERFTIPVGLSYMLGEFSVNFGALAAGGVVAALPVVLVFAFVQKYLVQGLSAGAVKG